MVRGWLSVEEVDGRASKLGVHVKRPVARQTSGVRYIFLIPAGAANLVDDCYPSVVTLLIHVH